MASLIHEPERGRQGRPCFSSLNTRDRLHECERRPSASSTKLKPHRKSIFKEEGLDDLNTSIHPSHPSHIERTRAALLEINPGETQRTSETLVEEIENEENLGSFKDPLWTAKLVKGPRPAIKSSATAPSSFSSIPRAVLIVCLIALVAPGFRYSSGADKINISGADAGVIRSAELVDNASTIEGRAYSPTDTCTRWAQQMANVNGTLFIFGGETKTSSGQTTNTWNNNFLTLDLTKSWEIASPSISGLPQPSGPPAVALGSLWHSYTSLFLYGGEFADNPQAFPLPVSTWEYNIGSSIWIEHSSPQTSAGNGSDGGDQPVQRAAEGAGLSVPELGRSWYFGGHLDLYTTPGWSNQIARVYLKSLLEFTHPGYANTGVYSLGSTNAAGSGGVYRNITEGGLQAASGFTERADGVLVYVPGWGDEGILLGLAGGTNETFTEMNVIDIYDVANSTWYKQSTSGTTPPSRVNPCAVVAAAPDGTSFNIYLYGGQNLIPAGSQIQYDDMWILTIPSFTWVQVDMSDQSQPPARAGHTCSIWDGQIVVVGGYVGQDISCDSPGIYVFNASSLQWASSFTALSGSSASNTASYGSSILSGSYGYQVPAPVQSVIGGGSLGGASATTPAAGSATVGPLATGKPPTYTITKAGSTIIQTALATSTASPMPQQSVAPTKPSTNVGAISAGVVASALAALAGYLGFCTWLYRKQLKLYKDHVAMAQRRSPSPVGWVPGGGREKASSAGLILGPFGTEISSSNGSGRHSVGESANSGQNSGLTPTSGITPQSSNQESVSGVYGGGIMPGRKSYSNGYGRLSEENGGTEYLGVGGRNSHSTAHSSMEDLLGNQEPSFFNVILNPRRTLRVVNSD